MVSNNEDSQAFTCFTPQTDDDLSGVVDSVPSMGHTEKRSNEWSLLYFDELAAAGEDFLNSKQTSLRGAQSQLIFRINVQYSNRGPARGCLAGQIDPFPLEMLFPFLASWMK